jgi:signal transduction histidine kinase
MDLDKVTKAWYRRISFRDLSIQQRLPLLICILLCSVILTFSFASYYGVKKVTLEMGKKRLRTLSDQLATMLTESSKSLNTLTLMVARQDTIKKNVQSRGTELRTEALEILNKMRKDSSWVLVELLDSNKIPVLWTGNKGVEAKVSLDTIFSSLTVGPDTSKVGKTYAAGNSMYYPVVASITSKKQVIGYLVSWRALSSSPKELEQLSQLMGTGATLYIGNTDGSLWTNLAQPVPGPPINTRETQDIFEYTIPHGKRVLAATQPIPTTQWWVLIEFSEKSLLEPATSFLNWIFIIGGIIIAIGIFITWLMSHNIIKPLKQLTTAAAAIATGDFSSPVKVTHMDELGKLGNAFNIMAQQIHFAQLELESKVRERTLQLENANKELESFSYSISHDLRAPLRAVIGFTSILEEEYSSELDDEAKRLTSVIKKNTQKMGDLIDDLLNFSRLARNDIVKTHINSNEMVREVINGLDAKNNIRWNIQSLPDINADINTIRQVWINLISNAIKYSRNQQHSYIEIGTSMHEGQNTFFVKDNGVGFDQQYSHKLFKVFQRLHAANEFEGTGVGLAIVEKIITKHGGKVWAEAEEGKGASFFFTVLS